MRQTCRATFASRSDATTGCFSMAMAPSNRQPESCCAWRRLPDLRTVPPRCVKSSRHGGHASWSQSLRTVQPETPAVTEYDLMMRALLARDVDAVDLRAPLLAAGPPVYRRTDAHWKIRRPHWLQCCGRRAWQGRLDDRSCARAARLCAGRGRRSCSAARALERSRG